jgi:hypothetical protein
MNYLFNKKPNTIKELLGTIDSVHNIQNEPSREPPNENNNQGGIEELLPDDSVALTNPDAMTQKCETGYGSSCILLIIVLLLLFLGIGLIIGYFYKKTAPDVSKNEPQNQNTQNQVSVPTPTPAPAPAPVT